MQTEKRRFVRYDVRADVSLAYRGKQHRCQTDDLGAGGCRIEVPWEMERGAVVEIALGSGGEAARGTASVAWMTHVAPFRVGLSFSDALAERAVSLIQAQLGSVRLHTETA